MSVNGITFDKRRVRAQDDARIRERLFPDGKLQGCAITYSGVNLTIANGYLMAKGRQVEILAETIASATTEANGYGRLKLVIDLTQTASGTTFTQYAWDWDYSATNSGWPALTQDDINDGTHTAYELLVCTVKFTSSNITSVVTETPLIGVAKDTAAAPALGTLINGVEYRCTNASTTTAPTITIAAVSALDTSFSAAVVYKSPGTTAPVVTNNSGYTLKYVGTDVSSGTFAPKAGTVYRISFVFDGIYLNAYVMGVA